MMNDPQPTPSAGLQDIEVHLTPQLTPPATAATPMHDNPLSSKDQMGLTQRQWSLPTLNWQQAGSFLAVLVLIVGVGSATILSRRSQDLRQQAYQARPGEALTTPIALQKESSDPFVSVRQQAADVVDQMQLPISGDVFLVIIATLVGALAIILIAWMAQV